MSEPIPLSVKIAARVRGLAAEKNITQMQLAAALGIAQPAVSRRMRGITPWSLDELAVLGQLLDVQFAVIIGELPMATAW